MLNTFGQSIYEGVHFLTSIFGEARAGPPSRGALRGKPFG
jgi:hypothetical protein